jgi:hypothetical protein
LCSHYTTPANWPDEANLAHDSRAAQPFLAAHGDKTHTMDRHPAGLRALGFLLALAIPLSLFHYTDNYVAFDLYPAGEVAGIEVTRDSIWVSWLLFTAAGLLGYWLYVRGQVLAACAALSFYSVSGLISIGHYATPGMSELAWWRHLAVWIDITLGASIILFCFWSAFNRRHAARGAT